MPVDRSSYETKLDPKRKHHVGIFRDEATEAYTKFFRWPIPALTDVHRAAMAADDRPAGPSMSLDTITLLEKHGYGTVVTARGHDSATGAFINSFVHAMRRTPCGCELRSRFFFPAGFDRTICQALIDHCATEMSHLASFLPRLYASITGVGPTGRLDLA